MAKHPKHVQDRQTMQPQVNQDIIIVHDFKNGCKLQPNLFTQIKIFTSYDLTINKMKHFVLAPVKAGNQFGPYKENNF